MNELQEMQDQMAQLKQETLALKTRVNAQVLRQRILLGLAVAGVGMALTTHNGNTQAGNQRPSLVCRSIKVVDANDNTVIEIGSTPDQEGRIVLYNGAAKPVVALSATKDTGDGKIWVYDAEGTMMTTVGSNGGQGAIWTKK